MKRKIALLFLVLTVLAGMVSYGEDIPEYKGIAQGQELLRNISYQDIKTDSNKDAIIRLSALGIVQGKSPSFFRPGENVTREEALMLILRLMGEEENAQKAGESLVINPDDKANKLYLPTQYWAEGYIQRAQDLNLLTPDEVASFLNFSDAKQDEIDSQIESQIREYERNANYTDAEIQTINSQLRRSLEWKEAYQKPLDRETFATWISRAMNLTPIYAKEQQTIRTLKDFQTIKTINLPYVEALYQAGVMKGYSDGTFRPDGTITRSQVVGVLDRIKTPFLEQQGYQVSYAYVQELESQNQYETHLTNKITSFLLKDEQGIVVRWTTKDSENPTDSLDFIVYKNGMLGNASAIQINDYYQYFVDQQNRVIFAETPEEPHLLKGTIFKLYTKEFEEEAIPYMQVKTEGGEYYDLMVSTFAHIRINDKYGSYESLIPDLEVTVKHFGGIAEEVLASIQVENPDYIPDYARVYTGKILSVFPEFIEVITEQGLMSFDRNHSFPILKKDKQITPEQIRTGDLVRVEMSSKGTNTPDRMVVLDQSKEIYAFSKGYLERVDTGTKKLILTNVQDYEYLGYGENMPMETFSLNRDAKLRTLETTIPLERLKNYQGREIYFWTSSSFGKEVVREITVKEGYEKSYLDGIKQISFGTNTITLPGSSLHYDDTTIFVKDGRIVDPRALTEGEELYVISHGNGQIAYGSIQNLPLPNYRVYRGELSDISTFRLKLVDDVYGLLSLQNNQWKKLKGYVDLAFSDETILWDKRNYTTAEVSVSEFQQGKYLKESEGGFIGASAYVIAYGDEILGIQFVDESKLSSQFNFGRIQTVDGANSTVEFEKVRSWDQYFGSFVSTSLTLPLDLEQAILVKGGKVILAEELSEGDTLYFSRQDNDVYFGLVLE